MENNRFIAALIEFFAKRSLLSNLLMLAILAGGFWRFFEIPKEARPNIDFDRIRITIVYPGASPEEVERLVIIPVENVLRGLSGILDINSTASQNTANITITLDEDYADKDQVKNDIRSLVLAVDLPTEVEDEPNIFEVKTTEFAILDVGIYNSNHVNLDEQGRRDLQIYAKALEDKLLSLRGVARVNRNGYLDPEIRVEVDPQKARDNKVTLNQISQSLGQNSFRLPAGKMNSLDEARVTLVSELDNVKDIENLPLTASFLGTGSIKVGDVATAKETFEETKSILRINGHEGVYLTMVKNASIDGLQADSDMKEAIALFKQEVLKNTPYDLAIMDDDSRDTRNRLEIISTNGMIAFVFILAVLFLFLNFEAGFWVALGIPISLSFTIFMASFLDITINNLTLAAAIIVMGMVVDDAIVVSENIVRMRREKKDNMTSVVEGTSFMFIPILASIITTCVAFIPLYFLHGIFGKFVSAMPAVIFLVLLGSFIESLFILPAHMGESMPRWSKTLLTLGLYPLIKQMGIFKNKSKKENNWFDGFENGYESMLYRLLHHKKIVFLLLVFLTIFSIYIFREKLNFVLFPSEEVTEITFIASAPEGTLRFETAQMTEEVENTLKPYLDKEVTAFRADIARSRRGSAIEENKVRMRIEILPREDRQKSADQLIAEWEKQIKKIKGFKKKIFIKQRFGRSDGSPIEILISDNDDETRYQAVQILIEGLHGIPGLKEIEAKREPQRREFFTEFDRRSMKRLNISPAEVANTLRASLEGLIPIRIRNFDEEMNVRVVLESESKKNIKQILKSQVQNNQGYLVSMEKLIKVEKDKSLDSISRVNFKRTTEVYADAEDDLKATPLEIAKLLEYNIFPAIRQACPTTRIEFGGEIKDSREAQSDLIKAICVSLVCIFMLLAIVFNSLIKPLIIIFSIPFGLIGIILAFWLHQKQIFGFFSAIGAIGLAGVIVNDAIIMVNKFDKYLQFKGNFNVNKEIASLAKTRLKAIVLTTLTTVVGLFPTAYGIGGYDSFVSEMMLAMVWGLLFSTLITLVLIPALYSLYISYRIRRE